MGVRRTLVVSLVAAAVFPAASAVSADHCGDRFLIYAGYVSPGLPEPYETSFFTTGFGCATDLDPAHGRLPPGATHVLLEVDGDVGFGKQSITAHIEGLGLDVDVPMQRYFEDGRFGYRSDAYAITGTGRITFSIAEPDLTRSVTLNTLP